MEAKKVYEDVLSVLVKKGDDTGIDPLSYVRFMQMSEDLIKGHSSSVINIGKTFLKDTKGGGEIDSMRYYMNIVDYVLKKGSLTSDELLKSIELHNWYWSGDYANILEMDYFDKKLIQAGFDGRMMRKILIEDYPQDIIIQKKIKGGGSPNTFTFDRRSAEFEACGEQVMKELWGDRDLIPLAAAEELPYMETVYDYYTKRNDIGSKKCTSQNDAAKHLIARERSMIVI